MEPTLFEQILSITGALVVLGAYILNLVRRIPQDGVVYAAMNMAGSGALGYVAIQSGRLGLIFVELAWGLVSLVALVRALLRKPASPAPE